MGLFDLFRIRKPSKDAGQQRGKRFKIPKEQIQRLVPNMGGCIASDMITVEGYQVGYMYREEPRNSMDSGWFFLSGRETGEYMDNAANHGIYEVNTICNYDKSIIPHLGAHYGTAFVRDPATGAFIEEKLNKPGIPVYNPKAETQRQTTQEAWEAWPVPNYPIVEGKHRLTKEWEIFLPAKFNRRIEDNGLCLWRPGFTIWVSPFGNDKGLSKEDRINGLRAISSADAFDVTTGEREGLLLLSYRLAEPSDDKRRPAYYCIAVADDGHLELAMYFDQENDLTMAQAVWKSVEIVR
jgi:hypothetical protein